MIAFILRCKQIYDKFTKDEMTVYAAQASFFIIIAAFPFIMLLMALIQFIPNITKSNLLQLVVAIVPDTIDSMVVSIIDNLYTNSPATVLSISAVAALWSASRGMLSIMRGLNRINGPYKKRNYFVTRFICIGYTVVFMVICVLTLILLVLGNSIQGFLDQHFPIIADITHYLISFRTVLVIALTACFTFFYTYVPEVKQSFRQQIPGAAFTTLGWVLFSFAFAIYFNNFSNFSVMYGSLTAIVLLMLWMYACICILFMGAEINYFLSGRFAQHKKEQLRDVMHS